MATEYSLSVAAERDPQQVGALLARALGLTSAAGTTLSGPALAVNVTSPSSLRQSVLAEAFGFRPTLSLVLRLTSNVGDAEHVAAKHMLLRVAMTLLQHEPGDAVLLFNGEQIVLQRIGGALRLNAAWSEWQTYDLLDEVTLPYELRDLPSPFL